VLRLSERARRALATSTQRLQARVTHSGQLLGALSYRSVLARGFALVRDAQDHPVHSASSIRPGSRLSVEFSDGQIAATADAEGSSTAASPAKAASSEPKPAAPKRSSKPVGQGSLF
jgi:exodeoxyribonuclease VII large subunit